jgi:Uma2 family endonuclease
MTTLTTAEPRTYTPEDLLAMPDGDRFELVDGHLVELHVSALSSLVAVELTTRIHAHCRLRNPAWIFGADCGYQCFPGHPAKVRKPDVSLILRERIVPDQIREGFLTIPPDLVIEVVSPNDLAYEVERKIQEYREAGVRLTWIVYPPTQTVHIHRGDGSTTTAGPNDELDGADVLPGFRCRIADLFASLPPAR